MNKYNILIVDDDELALRGIEKGVDWDTLAIDKIFKTHSAVTGKRILNDYKIHILLSDIELPGDNGLDLVAWVRKNKPEIICIFFTCHAEFYYAQEALRLGAMDYILKPIPYDKLWQCVSQAIKTLDERQEQKEKYAIIDQITREQGEKKIDDAIHRVKMYIMQNLESSIKREELAALVNFSPSYLGKIFKEKEGVSLTDYILEQRIVVAKQLLKVTELPITDISMRTGFSYPSYFTRAFKKATGITPLEYRENIRGEDPFLDDEFDD